MKKKYSKDNPWIKQLADTLDQLFNDEPDEVNLDMEEPKQIKKVFDRKNYYSQTEACAAFNINRGEFQRLCLLHNIPQVNKQVQMENYTLVTRYVLKEDFDKLFSN